MNETSQTYPSEDNNEIYDIGQGVHYFLNDFSIVELGVDCVEE